MRDEFPRAGHVSVARFPVAAAPVALRTGVGSGAQVAVPLAQGLRRFGFWRASEALPRCPHYQALDVFRGVACLLVVVFHSYFYVVRPASGAGNVLVRVVALFWAGVPLFFVISGYCIAASVDTHHRTGRSVAEYFYRRFRRIFPPYWVALALTTAAVVLTDQIAGLTLFTDRNHGFPRPDSVGWVQWIGNLTLTEQWRPTVSEPVGRWVLGQAWSLSYEEQFYAVMGFVLVLARRHIFAGAAAVTAACLVIRHTAPAAGVDGFFFDGYWPMFAAGILVYWQVNYGTGATRWAAYGVLGIGLLYCLRDSSGIVALMRHPGTDQSTFLAVLSAIVLLAAHPYDAELAESRWLRPISYCGRMCYSLYLVHWPVTKAISHVMSQQGHDGAWTTTAITVPLCLVSSIALARVFYLKVERPFQKPNAGAVRAATGCEAYSSARDTWTDRSSPRPLTRSCHGLQQTSQSCTSVPRTSGSR